MAPTSLQPMYGVIEPVVMKYGPPNTFSSPVVALFSLITTPIIVVTSFVVGSILYLITHKKIFLIIPLILSFLYLARYLLDKFMGVSF